MSLFDGLPVTGQVSGLRVVQEINAQDAEARAILAAAGITPDAAKADQLLAAIKQISWGNQTDPLPSKAEAEAGVENTKRMTPLRVAQAIAALGKPQFPAGALFPYASIDQPAWGLPLLGGAVSRTIYPKLFAVLCPVIAATTTASSAVITVPSTLHWYAGMPVEDDRFAAGTTVLSIDSSTTVTLSKTANAGGSGSLRVFLYGYGAGGNNTTFGLPLGAGDYLRAYDGGRGREQWTLTGTLTASSNVVTGIASTRGILIGSTASHGSITGGSATVAKITANSITLSATATVTVSGAALTVTGMAIGAEGADSIQGHKHYAGEYPGYLMNGTILGAGPSASGNTPNVTGTVTSPAIVTSAPISDGINGLPRTGPETTVKRLTVGMYICHGEVI